MSFHWKHRLRAVYAVAIVVVCLFFALVAARNAWRQRTQSRSNAAVFGVVAFFCLYVVTVLILQAITSRRYQRAVNALGLTPFDWKNVQVGEVVTTVLASGSKAFLSEGFCGEVHGADVYLFNYGFDPAWWSKRRTVAALKRRDQSPVREQAARLLLENAGAELTIQPNWFVVRARCRISADALARWVTTAVDVLQGR